MTRGRTEQHREGAGASCIFAIACQQQLCCGAFTWRQQRIMPKGCFHFCGGGGICAAQSAFSSSNIQSQSSTPVCGTRHSTRSCSLGPRRLGFAASCGGRAVLPLAALLVGLERLLLALPRQPHHVETCVCVCSETGALIKSAADTTSSQMHRRISLDVGISWSRFSLYTGSVCGTRRAH